MAMSDSGVAQPPADAALVVTAPLARFLCYAAPGGELPVHVDLARTWGGGLRSTHSFLLYLTDCTHGGETLLLETLPGDTAVGVVPGRRATLVVHLQYITKARPTRASRA